MTTRVAVGVLGYGRMGSAVAARLVALGHSVLAVDANPAAIQRAEADDGVTGASVHDISARSDTVVLALPGRAAVEAALEGVLSTTVSSHNPMWFVDVGTMSPEEAALTAHETRRNGHAYVSVPVLGGAAAARAGQLRAIVGSSESATASIAWLLGCIADRIFYVDTPGRAQAFKVCHQGMAMASVLMLRDILVVASERGLSPLEMVDMLEESPAISRIAENLLRRSQQTTNEQTDDSTSMDVIEKDVGLYTQMAAASAAVAFSGGLRDVLRPGALRSDMYRDIDALLGIVQ